MKRIDCCVMCDRPMEALYRIVDHEQTVRIAELELEDASQSNARR